MKNFRPGTKTEINEIVAILHKATTRPNTSDFLEGFPWGSVEWFLGELEEGDFERFLLFWESGVWQQAGAERYRTLEKGLQDFIKDQAQDPHHWNEHLREILDKRKWPPSDQVYLILISPTITGPYMILDGNHRAVATLWNVWESKSDKNLPGYAWIGVSPEVSRYRSFG